MRIVSWNVNGIRSVIGKGFYDSLSSLSPDVVFVQETKWTDGPKNIFPEPLPGYREVHTSSKVRKGYSGTMAYFKEEPLSIHFGLDGGAYDEEGRIITLEYPTAYLVGAYVPNSGEGLKRLSFRMEYEDRLLAYLKKLDAIKPVVYTGDLNVAHERIDIKNPDANVHNAGFTPEERNKMDVLLSSGFADTFRRLHPEEVKYSWWSYRFHARENNAGWRIDYFLVSERILSKVNASEIHNEIYGSDHCPVLLDIEL